MFMSLSSAGCACSAGCWDRAGSCCGCTVASLEPPWSGATALGACTKSIWDSPWSDAACCLGSAQALPSPTAHSMKLSMSESNVSSQFPKLHLTASAGSTPIPERRWVSKSARRVWSLHWRCRNINSESVRQRIILLRDDFHDSSGFEWKYDTSFSRLMSSPLRWCCSFASWRHMSIR